MNPFRESVVATPWEDARVDVAAIHGPVFEECLSGIEYVRQNRLSAGLLIHGEAGSGKTHLLRRLRARLAPQGPSATNRQEYMFVWVRLQTSPRMIWRTVRRTLVDDWFRRIAGARTQFQRILFHQLARERPAVGDLERWHEYMIDEHPDDLRSLIEEICDKLQLDRNMTVAFTHIAFNQHFRDLHAWLAGASLPEAALDRLDLAQDEADDEEREDQSRQVVQMLCRLAGNELPIVFSFDQVEALQTSPGDREALFAFGQLVSSLHDGTSNVLLISCAQSAFVNELAGDHQRIADYDRMKSLGSLTLRPLDRAQAEALIAARMQVLGKEFHAPGSNLAHWPLDAEEFGSLLGRSDLTPRRLVSRCAERFELRLGLNAELVCEPLPAFLEETWESRLHQKLATNQPDQTEEIVRHGLQMLIPIAAPAASVLRGESFRDIELVLQHDSRRVGLSICTQRSMTSRTHRVKRLRDQLPSARLDRLVLVCDARMPGPSATYRQYFGELEQRGAVAVFPTVEALAALDALRELLSEAVTGELAHRGEAVSRQTLAEWLAANLPVSLRDFVDALVGTGADDVGVKVSDGQSIEILNEILAVRPVLPLEEAARSLERPIEEVTALIRRHADLFGLLGQPPTTLFRPVDRSESSA